MNDPGHPGAPVRDPVIEDRGQQLPLLDYLQLLWFRRKLIIAITLFVAAVGYVKISEIKNVYSASATVLMAVPQVNVVDIQQVLGRTGGTFADVSADVEVMRSRTLAAKVIERLNLLNYAEFNPALGKPETSVFDFLRYADPRTWIPADWKLMLREALGQEAKQAPPPETLPAVDPEQARQQRTLLTAVDIFLGKLQLKQDEFAPVITVTFSSLDPKLAALVANDIPEAYVVGQLEARFEATEKANAWLTERLEDLKQQVVESERAVEIYKDEHGLGDEKGGSMMDAQLSELNSQLIIARAEKAETEARLNQLQRLLEVGGQGVETASEVMSSALVQQLRTQEAQALSRQSELSVEYGPKHPRMLQVQAEINEIRERIRSEVERIAAGLQNEVEFARTRVASLEASMREAQGETSEQNKEAIQLRTLQREAAANRALFDTFLTRVKETSSTQGMETNEARIISAAEVPGWPSYPDRRRMLMNYVLMGFIGACGLVLALHLLNPGMTSPEQVQTNLGEFVIGLIPIIPGKTAPHDYVLERPNSGLVEALNSMKFSLDLSNPDEPVRAIQVTSSVPEEGKTSLAICLARVMAASGKRVLLVDGDLRRSSIGRKLDLRGKHRGLSDLVVAGEANLEEFILRDEKGNVDYLPTGTAQFANATDIFSSARMQMLVNRLKAEYDLVIVDTPPVMAVADARIIGRVVDKTVFVVRWNKTPRKVSRAAVEQLRRAGVDLAGVVLQQVDLDRYGRLGYGDSGYYYHYGRYGKYYAG